MAKTLGKQNNNASMMKNTLEGMDLSLCLGMSKANSTFVQNSSASMNDSATNSSFAIRILPGDIHTALKLGTNESKYWKSNIYPGQYFSSGDSVGQYLYVQGNTVFLIVGCDGVNNRTDLIGSLKTKDPLTVTDGSIATANGFQYCAIKALDDFETSLSSKYIKISTYSNELKELDGSTSISTKMSNICGVGHAGTTGNCCLYRSTSGFDAIAGSTYDYGDFYKCICTECYKCVEIAEAMDMKYIFNKNSAGSTGSDCQCDSGTFPTDCGACGCTMDWNYNSQYSTIINDRNISFESSIAKNAAIQSYQEKNLSGSIVSVNTDLRNIPRSERLLAPEFEDEYNAGKLFVPLVGSCFKEASVPIICTYDISDRRYALEGIAAPSQYGSEYTSVSVDVDKFSSYFPDFPNKDDVEILNRFKVNVLPLGGIPKNIDNLFDLSCVIAMTVTSKDISDKFPMTQFDHYSIIRLVTDSGDSIYSGAGFNQKIFTSLVPTFECTLVDAVASPGDEPPEGEIMQNPSGSNGKFENTTIREICPYVGSIRANTLTLPLQCAFPEQRIGTKFEEKSSGTEWLINSISYQPTSYGGQNISIIKSDVILRRSMSMNFDQNPANMKTVSFELEQGVDPELGIYKS